jgi:hypothetical protein
LQSIQNTLHFDILFQENPSQVHYKLHNKLLKLNQL